MAVLRSFFSLNLRPTINFAVRQEMSKTASEFSDYNVLVIW